MFKQSSNYWKICSQSLHLRGLNENSGFKNSVCSNITKGPRSGLHGFDIAQHISEDKEKALISSLLNNGVRISTHFLWGFSCRKDENNPEKSNGPCITSWWLRSSERTGVSTNLSFFIHTSTLAMLSRSKIGDYGVTRRISLGNSQAAKNGKHYDSCHVGGWHCATPSDGFLTMIARCEWV
jgi:hypothetical protein